MAPDSAPARILVVDDDARLRALLEAALGPHYAVEQATDGRSGLAAAARAAPDLILVDIDMPCMTGYETCMLLKREEATRAVPVIFLSALDELDDRLAAYEAGGDDFLGKPFDPVELLDKVGATLRTVAERKRLKEERQSNFAMAMTALSTAGEIGAVLDFMRQSFACADHDALAEKMIGAIATYGLTGVVQLRGANATVTRNRDGASSSLESAVLCNLAGCGRIVALKHRLAISYERATLMVTDMPADDPDRAGRLRDHLAMVAEAADARIHALDDALAVQAQREVLQRLMDRTRTALADIDQHHADHRVRVIETLSGMLDRTEASFYGLGLTEAQEAALADTLREAVFRVVELFDGGLGIDAHLRAITAELESAS